MRPRMVICLGVVVLVGALAACGDDDGGSGDAADLPGTEWKLTAIGSDDVPADISASLLFHTDGTTSGSAGCNVYGGTWEGEGDELTLTVGPMTAMFCEDPVMQVETGFVAAMADTRSFNLDDDTLELLDDDGDTLATLEPLESASLTGGTWNATGVNNGSGGVVSVAPEPAITAVFADDGSLSGSAGCNTYTSSYIVNGDAITIQPAASTRMACEQPIMDQETAYLTALTSAATYELGENTLTLRATDGSLLVSYELAP